MQYTLKSSCTLSGIGLHNGQEVRATLCPAEENSGVVFVRTDLKNAEISAKATNVTKTFLQTVLTNEQEAEVGTIEHLMATLCALGIDNVRVEIDGPEVPILDGSASPWVEAIQKQGLAEQKAARKFLTISQPIEIQDGERFARIEPADDFIIDVTVKYDHPQLPEMNGVYTITPEVFIKEIAPARTFVLEKDVRAAQQADLAQGGSLKNAVVYGKSGPMNPEGLRFPDESLRHKILDCIGDLYMAGLFPQGKFTFIYPGHSFNNKALRKVLLANSQEEHLAKTEVA